MCKKWDGTGRLKMPVKSGLDGQTVLQEIPNWDHEIFLLEYYPHAHKSPLKDGENPPKDSFFVLFCFLNIGCVYFTLKGVCLLPSKPYCKNGPFVYLKQL